MNLISPIEFSSRISGLPKGLIVTDPHVMWHWGHILKEQNLPIYEMPSGESAKSLKAVSGLIAAMQRACLDRNQTLIAVGGGAITDAAGFAACIYMRGIESVYVPTTLLGMVDASIGGKTALNFEGQKNSIGTFHAPKKVIIAPFFLSTLPERDWLAGFAEIIKIAAIYDKSFFEFIETHLFDSIEETIRKAIELKLKIVKNDPFDKTERMLLNFGHTFGHGLEGYLNFKDILHGEAISIGMIEEAKWGLKLGITSKQTVERLQKLIERAKLPTKSPATFEHVYPFILGDKKREDEKIRFVLLEEIGRGLIHALEKAPAEK